MTSKRTPFFGLGAGAPGTKEFITRVGKRAAGKRYNPFKMLPKAIQR